MANVLIAAYLLIVLALIGVILLQRSEGGALGIGGNANFTQIRSQGNILTRTTAILAVLFFATAIGLTVLSGSSDSILGGDDEPASVLDELNRLGAETTAPATEGAAPPAPAADPALPVPTIEAPPVAGGPAASTPTESSAPATSGAPAPGPSEPSPASSAPADPAVPVPASP